MSGDDYRQGRKDDHGSVVMYWEPYVEKGEVKHAYTVDVEYPNFGRHRHRFDTLEEAEAKVKELQKEIAVYWAKKAFKLRN